MGAVKRVARFGAGGLIGAVVGGVAGLLFSPGSGDEVRSTVRGRLREARQAGEVAQAAKAQELIGKYRLGVNDPTALHDEAIETADAAVAVGMGLNAPGASAGFEATRRDSGS
jgi:gas vesicle protein